MSVAERVSVALHVVAELGQNQITAGHGQPASEFQAPRTVECCDTKRRGGCAG